jgi:hypothetical protein
MPSPHPELQKQRGKHTTRNSCLRAQIRALSKNVIAVLFKVFSQCKVCGYASWLQGYGPSSLLISEVQHYCLIRELPHLIYFVVYDTFLNRLLTFCCKGSCEGLLWLAVKDSPCPHGCSKEEVHTDKIKTHAITFFAHRFPLRETVSLNLALS